MTIEIPPGLAAQRRLGPEWETFLDGLPTTALALLDEWGLERDGPAMHGFCSLVLPVLTPEGAPAALKVAIVDDEGEHEHLALQRWRGDGAVQLLRADPHRRALLLERLRPTNLSAISDVEACEIVAGFYQRLHVPASPQLRTLTSYVERWAARLADLPRSAPVPRRLVEQAVSLARDFVVDPASTGVLIHADLHYENVLAADREPWLVIDPKPVSGDPHYEVAPMLWNRWDEIQSGVRTGVRRRFHALLDAAGLDEARARDWVIVRAVFNALWCLEDARGHLTSEDRTWLTQSIALAKAVQG